MKHSIEADGEGPVAVREPRRGLQRGAPLADLDDRASPGGLAAREGEPWCVGRRCAYRGGGSSSYQLALEIRLRRQVTSEMFVDGGLGQI